MEPQLEAFFEGKPQSHEVFTAILERTQALGPFEVTVRSQITFSATRQFAWFWLYNVTQKNPSGVLHAQLRVDERIDDPHLRAITQVSTNRWNHQAVVRTIEEATSAWLGRLLEAAYRFGST